MNHTPGTGETTADDGGFDPRQAAALLDQTTAEARRKFDPSPPLLSLLRAVVVLGAFGGIWLSVRGQRPYVGPSGWAIALAYIMIGLVIAGSTASLRRANAGVSGPAQHRNRASLYVLLVAWVAVYVFEGALYHAGVSKAIAFGLYPATGPLMIVGLAAAANAVAREDWRTTFATLTVALVSMGAAYGGPVDCWLVMGIGLCAVFLGTAAFTIWQQRTARVQA
jgi:hypothetical protein